MRKSAYLQQLDAHDSQRINYMESLQRQFREQPPLGWRPNATMEWADELVGAWVLVDTGDYCTNYSFRGPMILIDDLGMLHRTKRRLRFKNSHRLKISDIVEYTMRGERMTFDEIQESIRKIEELLTHERNRRKYEASVTESQRA